MIFTRFGTEVVIVADHGSHKVKGFKFPMRLVSVKFEENSKQYEFTNGLRATKGINEIEFEAEAAPKVKLEGRELAEALKEAE
jgi:hypothetical protein